jgi:hypothetical protein
MKGKVSWVNIMMMLLKVGNFPYMKLAKDVSANVSKL